MILLMGKIKEIVFCSPLVGKLIKGNLTGEIGSKVMAFLPLSLLKCRWYYLTKRAWLVLGATGAREPPMIST